MAEVVEEEEGKVWVERFPAVVEVEGPGEPLEPLVRVKWLVAAKWPKAAETLVEDHLPL